MEKWKFIEGFEGMYQVSNLGRVRSVDRMVVQRSGSTQFKSGMIIKGYKNKKRIYSIRDNKK